MHLYFLLKKDRFAKAITTVYIDFDESLIISVCNLPYSFKYMQFISKKSNKIGIKTRGPIGP